jgi:deoxyadenosine/deoxycytidine kinase
MFFKKKGKMIALVGASRSGKSFLAKKLAEHLKAEVFLEGEEGEFPARIEEDIKQNIRPLERILWFRNQLIKKHFKALELKAEGKTVVLDTFWMSVLPYVPVLTTGFEKELLEEVFDIDQKNLENPDLVILLQNNSENSRKFLQMGGRDFDSSENYLESYIIPGQHSHNKMFSQESYKGKLIVLDRSNLDFEKKEDLQNLLSKINAL